MKSSTETTGRAVHFLSDWRIMVIDRRNCCDRSEHRRYSWMNENKSRDSSVAHARGRLRILPSTSDVSPLGMRMSWNKQLRLFILINFVIISSIILVPDGQRDEILTNNAAHSLVIAVPSGEINTRQATNRSSVHLPTNARHVTVTCSFTNASGSERSSAEAPRRILCLE